LRREDNLGEWVTICSRKDEFSKTAQALREQDERSKKSSEAVKRLVEKKQKQRAQQEHKSSDAKSRDETAGQSLPTASNQESSEDIDQRKPPPPDQRRRAPAHSYLRFTWHIEHYPPFQSFDCSILVVLVYRPSGNYFHSVSR
jgi:hypothetical protein